MDQFDLTVSKFMENSICLNRVKIFMCTTFVNQQYCNDMERLGINILWLTNIILQGSHKLLFSCLVLGKPGKSVKKVTCLEISWNLNLNNHGNSMEFYETI